MEKTHEQQLITTCLQQIIRPQIQSHNGDIEFVAYKNDIVTVQLQGACIGCPLSLYTLKMGIFAELKKIVPSIKEVRDISEE